LALPPRFFRFIILFCRHSPLIDRSSPPPGEAGQDASLGFKFEQIQVYHRATDQYIKKSFPRKVRTHPLLCTHARARTHARTVLTRSYNRTRTRARTTQSGNKKAEKATKELLRFLYDGERIHYAVVDVLLARLAELILWLERDARGGFLPFLLLKTTLLLAYDTAEPEAGEAIQVKVHDSSARAHTRHTHTHKTLTPSTTDHGFRALQAQAGGSRGPFALLS
jgi:hypothetical protein